MGCIRVLEHGVVTAQYVDHLHCSDVATCCVALASRRRLLQPGQEAVVQVGAAARPRSALSCS